MYNPHSLDTGAVIVAYYEHQPPTSPGPVSTLSLQCVSTTNVRQPPTSPGPVSTLSLQRVSTTNVRVRVTCITRLCIALVSSVDDTVRISIFLGVYYNSYLLTLRRPVLQTLY